MNKLLTVLVSFTLLATASFADTLSERIQASYLIAFGRNASDGEVTYWRQQNPRSVSDLVNGHQQYLTRDANTHRATIRRSYIDALGREPNSGEYQHWMGGNDTYTQLMKNHVNWLTGNPGEYETVVKRSYNFVFNRQPGAAELQYWRNQGTISYAMLVAAHDTWRRANPSSPKTSGRSTVSANSSFLATVIVSPTIAQETRIASGLIGNDGSTLVAAGGGNLVGNDGASLVGNDGASMVAAGGGNLVAAGGGN